jgi:hypothetical protein
MIHSLKLLPEFWSAVANDEKNFEMRNEQDRNFREGDFLLLQEWQGEYTGRELFRKITYILRGENWGIMEGYCCMGLTTIEVKIGNLKFVWNGTTEHA